MTRKRTSFELCFDLLEAAMEGTEADLRTALDRLGGGSPEQCLDRFGQSALHWAVARMPGAVDALLKAGALPNREDNDGDSPISLAAGMGRARAFFSMVEAGADVSPRGCPYLLHAAAYGGSARIIEACLAAGHDPMGRDANEFSPLHHSALGGSSEAARLLLDAGADPSAGDSMGGTPLHRAAGRFYMARLARGDLSERQLSAKRSYFTEGQLSEKVGDLPAVLLGAGADPSARDRNGATALHCAASCGEAGKDFAFFLLDAGADARIADKDGETALLRAALAERPSADLIALLAEISDPDARDILGRTALHRAAFGGRLDACAALLEAGADPRIRDEEGKRASDLLDAEDERAAPLLRALERVELARESDAARSASAQPETPGRRRRI
jgi:ankyrin repeat protein